ncbi:MAG: hypothetical protein JXR37_26130 [Kiritimatiellae bacterium]|nr:hypothetical protein [Kiritimatiellia bacterium]
MSRQTHGRTQTQTAGWAQMELFDNRGKAVGDDRERADRTRAPAAKREGSRLKRLLKMSLALWMGLAVMHILLAMAFLLSG